MLEVDGEVVMATPRMKGRYLRHLWMPAALLLTIPAFYLVLDGSDNVRRTAGELLYGLAALLLGAHLMWGRNSWPLPKHTHWQWMDGVLLLGALASVWPDAPPWNALGWTLRLAYCAVVSLRLLSLLLGRTGGRRLLQICGWSLATLAAGGAGFYWLEPRVHSYADGLWLAFTTGATVGYADVVPSTPASRIFAVFIVLLGYALLSLVTANIVALLVGEDERLLRDELHADMRLLRHEIALLRADLVASQSTMIRGENEHTQS
jgi:voltage-gated potassium channel